MLTPLSCRFTFWAPMQKIIQNKAYGVLVSGIYWAPAPSWTTALRISIWYGCICIFLCAVVKFFLWCIPKYIMLSCREKQLGTRLLVSVKYQNLEIIRHYYLAGQLKQYVVGLYYYIFHCIPCSGSNIKSLKKAGLSLCGKRSTSTHARNPTTALYPNTFQSIIKQSKQSKLLFYTDCAHTLTHKSIVSSVLIFFSK